MKRRQFIRAAACGIGLAVLIVYLTAIATARSNATSSETILSGSDALAIAIAVDSHKATKDDPIEDYDVHEHSTATEYVVDFYHAKPKNTSQGPTVVNEGWEFHIDKKTFRITHIDI
jgi:hypothetical protein